MLHRYDMDKRAIRGFVTETLGCTCPETVFDNIKFDANTSLQQCQSLVSRIEVGGRLLIYLLVTDSLDIVERDLPVIIRNGKQERDRCDFNRFRAVVCTSKISAVVHLANDAFTRHTQEDSKVHLHVVSRDDVKAILGPTARA